MPRPCSVCQHPERERVDAALGGGRAVRETSALFRVSEDALGRHKARVPLRLAMPVEIPSDDLLAQVRALQAKAMELLGKAEAAQDIRTALLGVKEARSCLELLAKLLGELDERPVVNLLVAPEWLLVRSMLLEVLRPFPEPRALLSARLAALEANGAAGG